ncbi:MAG: 1,4-dihydroxy-6-naphthoate synthase [Saprospiraceae bacterium]|nr:1,4-dihydroxy-6-naphthoate synthase [Saprospiraceae bacterium]
MKLSLGFSPCPNDTFIFDALIHHKIDTEGLEFAPHMADVEELNQLAFSQELDVTKLSYHAFAHLRDDYALLNSGSALGTNCGPLLIARKAMSKQDLTNSRVAIPGRLTTANFLLSLAYPQLDDKREMLFSEIEQAVLSGDVEAGLIIHENRFTYRDKGLVKLADLGEFWEQSTGMPIPLGGIAVRRDLKAPLAEKIDRVLKRSVAFALKNPRSSLHYVRRHAQEMDEEVMYKHIELYVNDYTLELGPTGRRAIETLFEMAEQKKIVPQSSNSLFV